MGGGSRGVRAKSGAQVSEYSGVVFRSRLEARWALFFDLMGWDWDYEPGMYPVGGRMYIPDFWVDALGWVEVKGARFLTKVSGAKIARAVGVLPRRCEPFGRAGRLLIAGRLECEREHFRPVHNVVVADGGVANVFRGVVTGGGVELVGGAWMRLPSSGVLTDEVRRALCEPGVVEGRSEDRVANCYIVASRVGGVGRKLVLPDQVRELVSGRWAGRRIR